MESRIFSALYFSTLFISRFTWKDNFCQHHLVLDVLIVCIINVIYFLVFIFLFLSIFIEILCLYRIRLMKE